MEFARKNEKAQNEAQKALGEDGFAQTGTSDKASAPISEWTGSHQGIGSVDEVSVDKDGNMRFIRRLNGDQTHQGRHVRISVGDYKTFHVKLYEYE